MSDPTDNGQRNPLSSSSSHASGTSARSITRQPDQNPDVPQAARDNAWPSGQDSGAATRQDQYQNQDNEAGSQTQAEPELVDDGQSSSPEADQRYASTEPEAPEYTSSYEPPVGNYADDTPPADTGQDAEYGEPPAYHAAPADENNAGYVQPAAEYDPQPVRGSDTDPAQPVYHSPPSAGYDAEYTQRVAADHFADIAERAHVDQPLTAEATDEPLTPIDEPAYTSEAVANLDSVPPSVSDVDDAPRSGPLPNGSYPEAAQELRAAVQETIAENEARQEKTLALFDQVSRRFTAVLEEAGVDAARVTFKVMEFAQAGLKNNLELAKSYAAARSVTDIFGLHTAYMARQFELLNAQAEELRELTSKFALRNAARLKPQFERDRDGQDRR